MVMYNYNASLQSIEDLGNRQIRLKMNGFTWSQHSPRAEAEIMKVGNFICIEIDGRGGEEMRNNTNTLWEDITQCSHALSWAMPEFGDDVFLRWKGSRRKDTNRWFFSVLGLVSFPLDSFIFPLVLFIIVHIIIIISPIHPSTSRPPFGILMDSWLCSWSIYFFNVLDLLLSLIQPCPMFKLPQIQTPCVVAGNGQAVTILLQVTVWRPHL